MGYMYGNEYHKFMANISIVKLKVRRGSDTQRKTIVFSPTKTKLLRRGATEILKGRQIKTSPLKEGC